MAQGILPGFTVLEVQEEGEWYHVVYGFDRFYSFRKDDRAGLRMIVVQLGNMGVRKSVLQNTFAIARTSIDRWLDVYEQGGVEALVGLRTGPAGKVDESVRDYIGALYGKTGRCYGYVKTIQSEVGKLFGVRISRETVRTVLKARTVNREHDERAMDGRERSGGAVPVAGLRSGEEAKTAEERFEGADVHKAVAGEEAVLQGGVLLSLPLLGTYGVEGMVPRGRKKGSNGYQFSECFFSVFFLLIAGLLKVEEHIKLYDDPDRGGLIGRCRLPSLRTVRQTMGVMIEKIKGKTEHLKRRFAQRSLWEGKPGDPLYIDGHFMPYRGGEKTLKGYNSYRRLVEKGRMCYVVNTGSGKPIYEVLSDGFDHYHDNVSRLVDVLVDDLGIDRPTVVMDRGGFSEELFAAIEAKADFITWHWGNPKLPQEAKWEKIELPVQSNRWNEPDYETVSCTQKVTARGDKDGRGYRRVFFIKRGKKISPAITGKKKATLRELVLALTRRWGAQENSFKELKAGGYDCLHSYEKDKFSQAYLRSEGLDRNRMMENPECKKLVEQRRRLKQKRERIAGRNALRAKKLKKARVPFTKKQKEHMRQIASKLKTIEKRLSYVPENIRRMDYIEKEGIIRLASDKKKYFDLMNFVAFSARKDMAQIIGPVYKNNRDIHQIVLKFLRMKATVQKKENETVVTFKLPGRTKEKATLAHLCETLTAMEESSCLFPGKLVYRVT